MMWREVQNVLHHCNSHNGLRCLTALNGATCALGYFPLCLTGRSALTAAPPHEIIPKISVLTNSPSLMVYVFPLSDQ